MQTQSTWANRGISHPELDPRMKLLLVILISTSAYMASCRQTLILLYIVIVGLYLARRLWKAAWKIGIFFGVLLLIESLAERMPWMGIQAAVRMIVFFLERISVFFVMGNWMAEKLRIGDLIAAMQNMHTPKGLTVTLAVVFRYLPTVKDEFVQIQNAMRLRGINPTFGNIICHPLKTIEYAIVPLVIRSMKVADELAASAMTRGLDLQVERTSYRNVRLRVADVLATGVLAAVVICSLTFETQLWKVGW